jgi:hypothetical protein
MTDMWKATTNNPNTVVIPYLWSLFLEGCSADVYRPVLLIGDFAGAEKYISRSVSRCIKKNL